MGDLQPGREGADKRLLAAHQLDPGDAVRVELASGCRDIALGVDEKENLLHPDRPWRSEQRGYPGISFPSLAEHQQEGPLFLCYFIETLPTLQSFKNRFD